MFKFLKFTAVLASFASFGLAMTPVATVSSAQPFTMDGHSVANGGVSSWPVVVGDEISTASSPAVFYFRDGSSVKLAPGSSAKVTGSAMQPKVVLTKGTLDYKLVAGSKVAVSNASVEGQPEPTVIVNEDGQSAQSGAGTPSVDNNPKRSRRTLIGILTTPAVFIPLGLIAGAGAGAGIANALITRLPPVSNFQ